MGIEIVFEQTQKYFRNVAENIKKKIHTFFKAHL